MKPTSHLFLPYLLILLSFSVGYSQSVGIHTANPDSSAALHIESTNQGLLIPRMNTAQRTGIDEPAEGLLVFDSETGSFWYFQNSVWQELRPGVFKNESGVVKNTGDHGSDDFVFGSANLPPTLLAKDTLLFFDRSKGAFRVGGADSTHWKADSIGSFSFASGRDTRARGYASVALGRDTKAYGTGSLALGRNSLASGSNSIASGSNTRATGSDATAMGTRTVASGLYSMAIGSSSKAIGSSSTAMGEHTNADGNASVAMGFSSRADGEYSLAIGNNTHAEGKASVSIGFITNAVGDYSLATSGRTNAIGEYSIAGGYLTSAVGDLSVSFGDRTEAVSYASLALGRYNFSTGNDSTWIDTDPLLEIGIGTYDTPTNALTIFKNGNMVGGSHLMPVADSLVTDHLLVYDNADGSFRVGKLDTSDAWGERGTTTFAVGENTVSEGIRSAAFGYNTNSKGDNTTTFGDNTYAYGDNAVAMGDNAVATGYNTLAVGLHTTAQAFAGVAIGQFNVGIGVSDLWTPTDPVFEIGIGSSDVSRSNAFTVLKNGKTGIGTHLPDQLLDVRGISQIKMNSSGSAPHLILHEESTTDYARLRFRNDNVETHWTIAGLPESDTISSLLNFYLQGAGNIMSLNGSGRVGIRRTNPESALHIDAKPNDNGLRVQLNNNTRFLVLKNGGISMGANNNDVTSNDVYIANQLYFSGISNLPTHRIHLPNDSDDADGKGLAYEWAVYSDGRVKKDVEPLAYGLADVLALNPVSYNHHSSQFDTHGLQLVDDFESEIGFIAQEVQQVIAEAVNQPTDENQALWSMDYERLVPVLVKAIQELAQDNDALLSQLEQQTTLNERYEIRLGQIESLLVQLTDTDVSTDTKLED